MAYKVLYIEDNPDNMHLVKKALESRGYQFIPAASGIEGVDKAASEYPDVILLDINLPDIDGYEVARRLRSSRDNKLVGTPIIAITANALSGDAEKTLEAGCDVYMSKPINIHELWARVEAFLPEEMN